MERKFGDIGNPDFEFCPTYSLKKSAAYLLEDNKIELYDISFISFAYKLESGQNISLLPPDNYMTTVGLEEAYHAYQSRILGMDIPPEHLEQIKLVREQQEQAWEEEKKRLVKIVGVSDSADLDLKLVEVTDRFLDNHGLSVLQAKMIILQGEARKLYKNNPLEIDAKRFVAEASVEMGIPEKPELEPEPLYQLYIPAMMLKDGRQKPVVAVEGEISY